MGRREHEEPDGPDEPGAGDPIESLGEPFEIADHLPDDLVLDIDEDLDDDGPTTAMAGGPLPPDDRLWRHPSEIATAGLPHAARPRPDARPRHPRAARIADSAGYGQRLVAVGLSGVVGALLTASLLVATGRLGRVDGAAQLPAVTSSIVPVRSTISAGAAALVARVQAGVLAVQATRPGSPPVRGSALVLQPGYAITALRNVDAAATITVHDAGELRPARVVGSDAETDLALLAFDGAAIEPPPLGSSAALRPGDTAVTVTAPPLSAVGPSVTVGVVSALDRTMVVGKNVLRGVLQIDRPVPSEGAGGALIDATGNVVGITLPAADPATQVGYAIPIDAVSDISRQLLQSGHVSRPWLGIEGGDDGTNAGAAVWQVRPTSPAARAGVLAGDVVVAVDGAPVQTMDAMLRMLRSHAPGDTIKLTILRTGKPTDILVTLAAK